MNHEKLFKEIEEFKWETLAQLYGNAHSSVIGFISTSWINSNKNRFVLDGAYGINKDRRRHADLILCENSMAVVVVEVESGIHKYEDKIETIDAYLSDKSISCGILIMLNGWKKSGKNYPIPNWQKVKVENKKILLIDLEKDPTAEPINKEPKLNSLYKKKITKISCKTITDKDSKVLFSSKP